MPRFSPLPLALALCTALAAHAEEVSGPTVLQADKIEGTGNTEARASGNVALDRDGRRIEAQWLKLFETTREIRAGDQTRLSQQGDLLEGGELYLKEDTRTGELDAPRYRLGQRQGRGDAVKLLFEGKDKYRLNKARFTTCQVGQDDWFIRARELELDYTRNVGVARNSTIEFKGVPFLYTPYLDFTPRWLAQVGLSGAVHRLKRFTGGFEITVPWYWNIAPNMDATIAPAASSASRGAAAE